MGPEKGMLVGKPNFEVLDRVKKGGGGNRGLPSHFLVSGRMLSLGPRCPECVRLLYCHERLRVLFAGSVMATVKQEFFPTLKNTRASFLSAPFSLFF